MTTMPPPVMPTVAAWILACLALLPGGARANGPSADWPVYRGNPGGTQFAPLAQIHAANVHRLRPVWEYRTGDATPRSNLHANPVVIDGVMYLTTPSMRAVALDARTGREHWTFDPAPHNDGTVIRLRNRGVAYWKGGDAARIFHFVRERVYALDARTGALIRSFGRGGHIDLRENLGVAPERVFVEMTSPGAVYRNLLILGSRVNESYDASPGHIRAYDTTTGALAWIFHTIPQKGQPGHETWQWVPGENYGGANAWGGITVDERRGWVFAATGSPTDDFYGGFRKGDNLFGNCVLALDAMTGERKWHYQTIHHDLWDYDNPPAPILATITSGRTARDVVVQLTKMGFTFVLDRETGQPVFPVQELPVPRSTVAGEEARPTQPVPLKPPPLVRQGMTEADVTNITPEARRHVLDQFRRYVAGPLYTPPSLQGTITLPGHLGGMEWHGGSFDPALNVLYVNANELPTINRLRPVQWHPPDARVTPVQLGRLVYDRLCRSCHGAERRGTPPLVPPLAPLQRTDEEVRALVLQGRNSMPGFNYLRAPEVNAVLAYLKTPPGEVTAGSTPDAPSRYSIDGYPTFRDQDGYPAIAPPWGTLSAIDLAKGEILWKVPLGEYPELVAQGIRNTGTPNYGGAVATAGGLIFIGATADEKFRAFEKHTGRVLWEYQLPAGGYATPSIYMLDGRQYVVIAAGGGGKNATKSGDAVIAFALADAGETVAVPARPAPGAAEWIPLFDGKTLDGWVHLNGSHTYVVEDGAIVGRTVEGSENSFLCTTREFADFELELETMVDRVTNSGIQIRSTVRPVTVGGDVVPSELRGASGRAGRVNGPQVEIRRYYPGQPTTGILYGEAMGTGWLSSKEKQTRGHRHFQDEGWNKLRIVARGPRIQTWVNDQLIEDQVLEDVYRTHRAGFIGLQIHGLNGREPGFKEHGLNVSEPLLFKWRNIRIRELGSGF